MEEEFKLKRIPTLRTPEEFRDHVAALGIEIPCGDRIEPASHSPLAQPVSGARVNGKTIGNRYAVQPMEGWDATSTGGVTEEVLRRWRRFGLSGAKLIFGGEAMAVCPEGRANPNQLIIARENQPDLARLVTELKEAHAAQFGTVDDLVIGFQLTHSGRFCRPFDKKVFQPRIAYRHPILDRKFGIQNDSAVLTDGEVGQLIELYADAAGIAAAAGADFVDIKHCHGYLLHEFLGAFTRPAPYGGSFENRTRILRDIVAAIRRRGLTIDIAVRLSAFDFVPFRPDPARSRPGKPGPGIPEDYSGCLPYRYGFGVNRLDPTAYDLAEPLQFMALCADLGVRILNVTAGSPYYNPHIQRPAAYPPSDGYAPAHDPLIDVARQLAVVRELKGRAPPGLVVVGSAYSYLQEYLPLVAQETVRRQWTDLVGLGRMILSYPAMLADALAQKPLEAKTICRTFSDCTTAPRNGLKSGCYPLDKFYSAKPEFATLKEIKKRSSAG